MTGERHVWRMPAALRVVLGQAARPAAGRAVISLPVRSRCGAAYAPRGLCEGLRLAPMTTAGTCADSCMVPPDRAIPRVNQGMSRARTATRAAATRTEHHMPRKYAQHTRAVSCPNTT